MEIVIRDRNRRDLARAATAFGAYFTKTGTVKVTISVVMTDLGAVSQSAETSEEVKVESEPVGSIHPGIASAY